MSLPWKILSVDDQPQVHELLKLALEGYHFEGRSVVLLSAQSALEAQEMFQQDHEIAVAVIDVVMETSRAGLDLVRFVREVRGDRFMRIVLLTGQTADFFEDEVVAKFEINDFWPKTETSLVRMRTAITTCLRGLRDIKALDRHNRQIRLWADRLPDLLEVRDWMSLVRVVLLRLKEVFIDAMPSTFLCRNDGNTWPIVLGTGRFPSGGSADILSWVSESEVGVISTAWETRSLVEQDNNLALYFETYGHQGYLFFWQGPPDWGEYEKNTSRLILQDFRAAVDNLTLIQQLETQEQKNVVLQEPNDSSNARLKRCFLLGMTGLRVLLEGGDTGAHRALQLVDALSGIVQLHDITDQTLDFVEALKMIVDESWQLLSVPLRLDSERSVGLLVLVRDLLNTLDSEVPKRLRSEVGKLRLIDLPRALVIEVKHPIRTNRLAEWTAWAQQIGAEFHVVESEPQRTVWRLDF